MSDHDPSSSTLRLLLEQQGLVCPVENSVALDLAVAHLARVKPDLLVVELGNVPERALEVMAGLRAESPARMLAVGPASDPKLVIRALRSGADDYLDEGDLETNLREALPRCRTAMGALEQPGRVIAILAPSGGSGSSTLAINVATVLAQRHEKAVLIDMKLEAGDLAPLLDLRPAHTLADLCQHIERMDESLFQHTLAQHRSGVSLLSSPSRLNEVQYVTPEAIGEILRLARSLYPYVIIDLDHSFRDEQAEVLRRADEILMVMRLSFTALRNVKRTLAYMETLGLNRDRVRLVVNSYGQAKEITPAQAEDALGMKISHYVPDDPKTVNRANNNGTPVVLESPGAKVSQCIVKLAVGIDGLRPAP